MSNSGCKSDVTISPQCHGTARAMTSRRHKAGLMAPLEDPGPEAERIEIEEDTEPAQYIPDPGRPSQEEVECHRCDHWPFRSWCEWCVKGRGVGLQHRSRSGGSTIQRVGIDYFFMTEGGLLNPVDIEKELGDSEEIDRQRAHGSMVKCILIRCWDTKCIFAHAVPRKGRR